MKQLLISLFSLLLLQFPLMGATPFNLEGLKAVNILILDENDILTPVQEQQLKAALKEKLQKNGIACQKDGVGAIFLKLHAIALEKCTVIHLTLGVGEETKVPRGSEVLSYALTYSLHEMIESHDIYKDVYENSINYLLDDFIEQLEEDNEQ